MTGLRLNEDWDYRLSLNYRDQNSNIGKSNKTFASGFDMPVNNRFSVGEFVINNNSINSSLNTFNLMLSGAYRITRRNDNRYDRHNLSVGLQAGLLQQSANQNNFLYDSQYSSTSLSGFDASLPSGENLTKTNTFNFDANMGVYYKFVDKNKKYAPFGGFSIYHLTRPNQSYTPMYSAIPMRFTLQGGCLYTINETFSVLPQFLYMDQANVKNINIGVLGYEKIRCTDYQIMLGAAWRNTDAVIIHAGLKYKTYNFRVSYDIATNYLKQYGNRGIELSLVLTFKKKISKQDLVATLIINPDTSLHLKTPVTLPLPEMKNPPKLDTTSAKPINKDSAATLIKSKKSLPKTTPSTINDSAKNGTVDSSVILLKPKKTLPVVLPKVKDSAKSGIPVKPFARDSSSTSATSEKIILTPTIVKDSAKSSFNTNPIILDSTATLSQPEKKGLSPLSAPVRDSAKSSFNTKSIILDSTATLSQSEKTVPPTLSIKKDSTKLTFPPFDSTAILKKNNGALPASLQPNKLLKSKNARYLFPAYRFWTK